MAVSGTMALTQATIKEGRAAIEAQRGTATWGANWVYSSGGMQEDILLMSNITSEVRASGINGFSTSGTAVLGSADYPIATSGIYINAADGTAMQLVVYANGLVSGVVA